MSLTANPNASVPLLLGAEYQDYLLFSDLAGPEMDVPTRSPARPTRTIKEPIQELPSPTVSDTSSFEDRTDGSVDESIFSAPERKEVLQLDEDGLNLDGIDDLEAFLLEISSDDVIFQIDDVVTIVGLHSGMGVCTC